LLKVEKLEDYLLDEILGIFNRLKIEFRACKKSEKSKREGVFVLGNPGRGGV